MTTLILSTSPLMDELKHGDAHEHLDPEDRGPLGHAVLDLQGQLSQALSSPEPGPSARDLGATTLQLVERGVDEVKTLRQRLDAISAQAHDFIQRANQERYEREAALHQAREEAAEWRRHAMELELAVREAQLRAHEAELGQRQAEQAASDASRRAQDAEAEAAELATYMHRISDFLRVNLGA